MANKSNSGSIRIVLRFIVGLTTSIFLLTIGVDLNAGGYHPHKGGFPKADSPNCGDTISGHAKLARDLDCSEHSGGAALTLQEGASLNMNGRKIIGNSGINCIEIGGDATKIWGGAVTQCDYGIRVRRNGNSISSVKVSNSDGVGIRIDGNKNRITSVNVSDSKDNGIRITGDENRITSAKVSGSDDRGIRIDGDDNRLIWCTLTRSHTQGIKINGGNDNQIISCKISDSCRDGIEIDGGSDNMISYNRVDYNGNPETCADFGEEYKPWYYAGIDVLVGSENNMIKRNRAGCNLGCEGSDLLPCTARSRDFWDENVESDGNINSSNEWGNNSIACENSSPEYSPNPDD